MTGPMILSASATYWKASAESRRTERLSGSQTCLIHGTAGCQNSAGICSCTE
ncbi:MAG: hypothetical protein ACLVH3_13955 [Blautia obeum]